MMTIEKVEIEVNIPYGFESAGYRPPKVGEYFLDPSGGVIQRANTNFQAKMITLRRVKQYREPVLPGDYDKYVEFSNDGIKWTSGFLFGWRRCFFPWQEAGGQEYACCRIEVEAKDE